MPLAVCFQILVARLASQQLDPFASSRPLLHTRPPSDAVLRRWCTAFPPRPNAAPNQRRPPTCRARSTTRASSNVETKAGTAGQPEHTCQLPEAGRGWRPPCACSGAGGACRMAEPSFVESKLAPPPRPTGSPEALSAPEHASGCSELRPASRPSASPPLGPSLARAGRPCRACIQLLGRVGRPHIEHMFYAHRHPRWGWRWGAARGRSHGRYRPAPSRSEG